MRSREWRDDVPGARHGRRARLRDERRARRAAVPRATRGGLSPINLLVVPCVSPWAYERIHRWNANAVDPNRSFREGSAAAESAALMRLVAPLRGRVLLHVDLHETTDTDESEFRPALAARDGKPYEPGHHPGRLLSRRRQRESAARIPARDHRRGRQGHAHRAGRRQERDHRLAGRRAGRHQLSAARARPVRGHHRRALHDDDRGVSRQPARDARAMQRRAGRGGVCGDRVRIESEVMGLRTCSAVRAGGSDALPPAQE